MGQQEAKLPSCPPRSPRAVYLQSPRQAWRMFPAALDASGINAALSWARRENDKGPLFPLPALRLQLPTLPTNIGRPLPLLKAKEATGLL